MINAPHWLKFKRLCRPTSEKDEDRDQVPDDAEGADDPLSDGLNPEKVQVRSAVGLVM